MSLIREGRGYTSYLSGNAADVRTASRPGFALCGGGKDVDEAMSWLLEHSGGGDVLILRASGEDGYNDYLMQLGPAVDSVESVVIHDRAGAQQPEIAEKVAEAEAIFIAGGDQQKYLQRWQGTPLQSALQEAVARGTPLGGTSAGLAVLGDPVFAAPQGEVFSQEVLQDPCSSSVEFAPRFLAIGPLENTLTDTHFSQRDRLGRLVAFVSRQRQEGRNVSGLGVDERTALLIDGDGSRTIVGEHDVVQVEVPEVPGVCRPGAPLSVEDVQVRRMSAKNPEGERTKLRVEQGRLQESS